MADEPKKPILRYSLRGLLGLITVLGVVLGIWANKARQRVRAIAQLESHGARIYFASQCDQDGMYPLGRMVDAPWNPTGGVLGDEWFNTVANVQMPYIEEPSRLRGARNAPKSVLKPLAALDGLKQIRLSFTDVANDDLTALAELSSLKSLTLQSTKIHEGNLNALSGLPLESLSLTRTRFDDEGLESVARISTLQYLNLTRTKVTDEGLRYLENHPNLQTLILRRCLVTKEGYERIRESLPNCNVSWQALKR